MRSPAQFAVGARVADPLEGRTGHIAAFDSASGLYTLAFHDGHELAVDEAGAARYVIKTTANSTDATANATSGEDPEKLCGTTVSKVVTAYDGETATVTGYVFSYIPSQQTYHVNFVDESRAEWTREQVKRHVVTAATRDASESAMRGKKDKEKKRTAEEAEKAPHKTHKKPKRASDEDNHDDDDEADDGLQLNQTKYPSRTAAYAVIRKVLCVILAQSMIKKTRTEKQVTVLHNEDLKPKRALENFVEAGGLLCLQKVLVIWMRKPATHAGALLILKVLAALPGVTPEAVLQSNMGKTLRGIVNVCQTMRHVDRVLGDLAEWIIRSWKRGVLRQPLSLSTKALIRENSSQLRAVDTLPLYIPPAPTAEKHMSAKQAMTLHLQRLLSGETSATSPKTTSTEAPDDENVIFLPQFNSLGSEDARRPQRQVILLDTLAAKINRQHVEGLRKQQDERADSHANSDNADNDSDSGDRTAPRSSENRAVWANGRDNVAIGRLVFRRPQIQLFDRNALVMHLRATVRSRLLARQAAAVAATVDGLVLEPDEVPVSRLPPAAKAAAPRKSILKVRDTTFVPAAQVQWRVEAAADKNA